MAIVLVAVENVRWKWTRVRVTAGALMVASVIGVVVNRYLPFVSAHRGWRRLRLLRNRSGFTRAWRLIVVHVMDVWRGAGADASGGERMEDDRNERADVRWSCSRNLG